MTPVLVRAHLSTASNWIGVETGVHWFDSYTPHKPVDVGGQRGGCQQLSQCKGSVLSTQQVGLIQVNDDEERNGGQAGRVYGCQL